MLKKRFLRVGFAPCEILVWISCENYQVFFNIAERFYLTLHRFSNTSLTDNTYKYLMLKCVIFPLIPAYFAVRAISMSHIDRFFHKSVNTEALSTHYSICLITRSIGPTQEHWLNQCHEFGAELLVCLTNGRCVFLES